MHRLWNSIVQPLFLAASPKVIVEVGCAEGGNTMHLLDFCKKQSAVLHAIDPKPRFDTHTWQSGHGDRFLFHRGKSLDILPSLPSFDVVLLDGDHNWYTVFHELLCIETMAKKSGRFPLVLLHDTEWPYARRDLYANPEDIPPEFRRPHEQRGILLNGELSERCGLNPDKFHARTEGGPRNGVRTAIEDFLAQTSFKLTFVSIPGCHGLGILGTEELLSSAPFKAILESWTPAVIRHCRQLEEERLKEQERLRGQRFLYERLCDRSAT
ncbi:MAG: class I SAM-dependent methyltransferase, partial [Patescibacteria group bacterium]